MAINYIDGPRLARVIVAGAQWVATKRLHLNEINVFPVPDGDTGTNMTLTLKAAADAVRGAQERTLGEVASVLSRAVLIGARGNAGIILGQFLRGFAKEIQGVDRLYPRGFAKALADSIGGAYDAMSEPVEGTILTVIRESSEEASAAVEGGETDFIRILGRMRARAAESLASTPELLPVLKEAGVVDAGGEGFVDLLEGMLRCIRGEKAGDLLDSLPSVSLEKPILPDIREQDLKYRYCTEFLLEGPRIDPADVRIRIAGLGGSLITVGGPGLVRAHIHTNEPEKVLDLARELGEIRDEKIDDMREQHREFIRTVVGARSGAGERRTSDSAGSRSGRSTRSPTAPGSGRHRVRVVTDSTADLPFDVAEKLGIAVIPLSVIFGDSAFRDGVDMTPSEFYSKLAASTKLPTTSQPTPGEFSDLYDGLSWETKAVLSIHISSKMSGTVQAARAARKGLEGLKVEIVDSGLVSIPLGMTVVAAARAAERGAALDELVSLVHDLAGRARVYFTVETLEYLSKGGRIGRARALAGRLMNVRPILTIEEGIIAPAARARGPRDVLDKLLELTANELTADCGGMLGIVHAQRPDVVGRIQSAFFDRFRFDEAMVAELGGIVGTHVGPGAWGVSYFRNGVRQEPPGTQDSARRR